MKCYNIINIFNLAAKKVKKKNIYAFYFFTFLQINYAQYVK